MSADPKHVGTEEVTQPFYIAAHDSLVDEPPRTLKYGDTFALFDHYGDLASRRGNTLGLYHRDTRHLSRLKLTIERRSPLLLCSTVRTNNAVLDVDLTNPDIERGDLLALPKDTVHFSRMKFLWQGACYETITFRNYGAEDLNLRIDLDFDADFADLFEVRGFERQRRGTILAAVSARDAVRFDYAALDGENRFSDIYFSPPPDEIAPRHAGFVLSVAAGDSQSITMSVHCSRDAAQERRVFYALRAARRQLREATRR